MAMHTDIASSLMRYALYVRGCVDLNSFLRNIDALDGDQPAVDSAHYERRLRYWDGVYEEHKHPFVRYDRWPRSIRVLLLDFPELLAQHPDMFNYVLCFWLRNHIPLAFIKSYLMEICLLTLDVRDEPQYRFYPFYCLARKIFIFDGDDDKPITPSGFCYL